MESWDYVRFLFNTIESNKPNGFNSAKTILVEYVELQRDICCLVYPQILEMNVATLNVWSRCLTLRDLTIRAKMIYQTIT